jgi:uracil-DNA glycosylase
MIPARRGGACLRAACFAARCAPARAVTDARREHRIGIMTQTDLDRLLVRIRACRACAACLPLGPRPILQAGAGARLLIVGQAPGRKAHADGIPWNDASGERLRAWLGIDADTFHDPGRLAIVPVGFCYPGRSGGGDRPPRPECAPLWFAALRAQLPRIELTLAIGQYAQRHVLGVARKASLTATVRAWRDYGPYVLPLPHPSPRNTAWLQRQPWFAAELLPVLRARVRAVVATTARPRRNA